MDFSPKIFDNELPARRYLIFTKSDCIDHIFAIWVYVYFVEIIFLLKTLVITLFISSSYLLRCSCIFSCLISSRKSQLVYCFYWLNHPTVYQGYIHVL